MAYNDVHILCVLLAGFRDKYTIIRQTISIATPQAH